MRKRLSEKEHRENLLVMYNQYFMLRISVGAALLGAGMSIIIAFFMIGANKIEGFFLVVFFGIFEYLIIRGFRKIDKDYMKIREELGIPQTREKYGLSKT